MNSILRVGDGDVLYREQWNLSGDRRVSIVLSDLNPRRRLFSFMDLFIPSVFHKTLSKYTTQKLLLNAIFLYEQGQIRSLSGLQTSKLN